jgi:hypothetical protein
MKKIILSGLISLTLALSVSAQLTFPRESPREELIQTVGDTKISIVYHRINTVRPDGKSRKIFGCETTDIVPKSGVEYPCLIPNGQVWRTGANENATFEVSNDVTINGQALPKGKYGLHSIPNKNQWVFIFSKTNDAWGSFTYDVMKDALRVNATPAKSPMTATMAISFGDVSKTNTSVAIAFDKVKVGFDINVGDVAGRVMSQIRTAIENRKSDDVRPLNQGTGYVVNSKLSQHYAEAMTWIEKSISIKPTFAHLSSKARLLGEMGKVSDAIATGEMAISTGQAATPKIDTTNFEKTVAGWKKANK